MRTSTVQYRSHCVTRKRLVAFASFLICLCGISFVPVSAQDLMVLPVNVQLGPGQGTTTLTITNKGKLATAYQVRVYGWSEQSGLDELLPTDAVIISPPLATIPPSGTQIVRVLLRKKPLNREATYRLIIDQIPAPVEAGQVQLVLRLSIPIFAQPDERTAAHVHFHIEHAKDQYALIADNDGGHHEKIRGVHLLLPNGSSVPVITESSPYILAGSARRWPFTLQSSEAITTGVRLAATEDKGPVEQEVHVEEIP